MSQNRRYQSRMLQAKKMRQITYAAAAVVLVLLLVLIIRLSRGRTDAVDGAKVNDTAATDTVAAETETAAEDNDQSAAEGDETAAEPGESDQLAEELMVAATKMPMLTFDPDAPKKNLAVIYHKKDETNRICITIDDCFSEKYMRAIIKVAEENGADLTFFPKGEVVKNNPALWREIYEKGYQIENHSFYHSNVTTLSDEKLYNTITYSEKALNDALGVYYHQTIFRPPTGDGMHSPRLHQFLRKLGYQAVASWGLSGTQEASKTLAQAKPGQLILFHATQKDYERLKVVIPGLKKKGYEMVSVNTLYGKERNKVTPLNTFTH